jgi:molecular chaperone DnaK (HSP70)
LEGILERCGFYGLLNHTLNALIQSAYYRGILKADIKHILLVGGTTLLPSVRKQIANFCPWAQLHHDRPLEAVVHGAVALGQIRGLQDHLFHDYAIRYWDNHSQAWAYQSIFQRGQSYPTRSPQVIELQAVQPQQTHLELVIGELETRSANATEISIEKSSAKTTQQGRLIAVVSGKPQTIFIPLHEGTIARLDPPAQQGHDRLRVEFRIGRKRELLITVIDLLTNQKLIDQQIAVQLR